MTIYFAGGEFGAVTGSDANAVEQTADTGLYSTTYSRASLQVDGPSSFGRTAVFAPLSTGYAHFRMHVNQNASVSVSSYPFYLMTVGGTGLVRLLMVSGTVKIQYFNGSAFVDATTTSPLTFSVQNDYDLYFNFAASGALRLYVNGSLLLDSGTLNLASMAAVGQVWTVGTATFLESNASEIIVADVSTIGWRLGTIYPTAAGTTNTFTAGTYVDVDEAIHSDADFISSDTANQIFLANTNDLAPGAFTIKGVCVAARAKTSGVSPVSAQLAVRTSATNYFSSTKTLGAGYSAEFNVWETNPNTGIAWTEADIAALQIGVKSIA